MSPACYQLHHPATSGETRDLMWGRPGMGRSSAPPRIRRQSDCRRRRGSARRRHRRQCEHFACARPRRSAAHPQPCGRIDRPQPARPSSTRVEHTPNARSTRMMMAAPHKGREHATKRPNHRGDRRSDLRGLMFRGAGHGAILVVRESETSIGRSCQGSDTQSIYPSPTRVSSMRGN